MAQAAVPHYVTTAGGFADCAPGHRFNLYFEIWERDWKFDKTGKADALRKTLSCHPVTGLLEGVRLRQRTLAEALPDDRCHVVEARSTSPFSSGLGLEHPVENGFAFLSPYGLAYLAGSGVKGVLRKAAEELRDEDVAEISSAVIDALFGHESDSDPRRGALTFWDVFPKPANESLAVEIMTPHFDHYYQNGGTPHDAGKPNPIPFLAVPAGSDFRFVVTCEPALLGDAVVPAQWKHLLDKIMRHAFDWLGFGAKTSVGYGAMGEDPRAKEERIRKQRAIEEALLRAQHEHERQEALSKMSPIERSMREYLDARSDKNQPELSALMVGLNSGKWTGEEKIAVARAVKARMQTAKKWKEKTEKKNPLKDFDHQDTLKVQKWIAGT